MCSRGQQDYGTVAASDNNEGLLAATEDIEDLIYGIAAPVNSEGLLSVVVLGNNENYDSCNCGGGMDSLSNDCECCRKMMIENQEMVIEQKDEILAGSNICGGDDWLV